VFLLCILCIRACSARSGSFLLQLLQSQASLNLRKLQFQRLFVLAFVLALAFVPILAII